MKCVFWLRPRLLPPTSLSLGRRDLLNKIMDRYREKSSALFTRIAHGISWKQPRCPAPQTSPSTSPLVRYLGRILINFSRFHSFGLPDELILSVLSHVSPDPWLTGHYARFCIPYCGDSRYYHKLRVKFLRPLSMQGDEDAIAAMGIGTP